MVRPKKIRRISKNPEHVFFNHTNNKKSQPIELIVDEFEAIRLRDYHDIKQKESAELMGISQPTFHRILISARGKLASALIDGKEIIVTGDDFMSEELKYKCESCGFLWSNPEKQYEKCPDCGSSNIELIKKENDIPLSQCKSFGGPGRGDCLSEEESHNSVCKCPKCGYEAPKVKGVPCRNKKCPECGTPLHGTGRCAI